MITIVVKFIRNAQIEPNQKAYRFLCDVPGVKTGDIILDNRYDNPMKVIELIYTENRVFNGKQVIKVKIDLLNGQPLVPKSNSRYIELPLDTAKDWYRKGPESLRQMALKAYKEKELKRLDLNDILRDMDLRYINVPVSSKTEEKVEVWSELAIVAEYLNEGWEMCTGKTGYFLSHSNVLATYCPRKTLTPSVGIFKHRNVTYPGIVYFRSMEAAEKAYDILKDSISVLFD